jgi:vacuolar-type H+-ATPase subunit I/STV1
MSKQNIVQNTMTTKDKILIVMFIFGLILLIVGAIIKYKKSIKNISTTTGQMLMYLGCCFIAPKASFFLSYCF